MNPEVMNFEIGNFYHIYNRSFQGTTVFYSERNYQYSRHKLLELKDYCHILAYCLMPDHFHLLVYLSEQSTGQKLPWKLGTILSSYTQGINKQEKRTGSLFQNSLRRRLVSKIEDRPFSSFKEYLKSESNLCDLPIARQLIDLPSETSEFYRQSYAVVPDQFIKQLTYGR